MRCKLSRLVLAAVFWAVAGDASSSDTLPSYRIDGLPGRVSAVTIRMPSGERIVADGFLDDPGLVAEERGRLGDQRSFRGSCAFAAAARPFTRLRRFDASDGTLWEWRIDEDEQALRFLGPKTGDCLSPDARHLVVAIYRDDPEDPGATTFLLGNGIVAVGTAPGFEEAAGQRTGRPFGHPRFSEPLRWRDGEPATFEFEVFPDGDQADAKPTTDAAVLAQ